MILAIGDSLGVGSDPFLRERVAHVRTDSRSGRTSTQGRHVVHEFGRGLHKGTLVFALGTNDFKTATFRRNLRVLRRENPTTCLVLVTIYRSGPVKRLNRIIRSVPRAKIVPWAHYARRYVGSDGIHATIRGYRLRARLIAAKMRACDPDERM